MSYYYLFLVTVVGINFLLGLLVYFTNSRRTVNQQFFLTTACITLWQLCIGSAFVSSTEASAAFWIRLASVAGAFHPYNFNLLRLTILHRDQPWRNMFFRSWPWFAAAVLAAALCETTFYLKGAVLPSSGLTQGNIPEPVYGPGFKLYNLYYSTALLLNIFLFVRDTVRTRRVQRSELQFVMLGMATCVFVGVLFALLIPLFIGNSQSVLGAPFCAVFLVAVIAYGIATRRIMDVAYILRRSTAYALLTVYLVALYGGVWLAGNALQVRLFSDWPMSIPHLLAALAVAFAMAPANGFMQRFANRLFITSRATDLARTVGEVNQMLQSISTLPTLLDRFSKMVAQSVGADHVAVLLMNHTSYTQRYPELPPDQIPIQIPQDDLLVRELDITRESIVGDELLRRRPSPHVTQLGERLEEVQAAVAVAVRSPHRLEGILLLGQKLSGRIYGSSELDTLQILCDQLAVALENSELYTQTENSKIYNEILLDNLASGVIAVNGDGLVTVINREAQRITGLTPDHVIQKSLDTLPRPLAEALKQSFRTGESIRDQELTISRNGSDAVPIRASSSIFRGYNQKLLGTLLVFNDLSAIKKLETQVRRTDRLASVGTLAAGMAHEIKNPLVTIKTFTQLLPERYTDEEFRGTFSSLVGHEVKRIDSIVNQLLRFARPAKPDLAPRHLHEIMDHSLSLAEQQLKQKNIVLKKEWKAPEDMILADADILQQAFINFLLNAVDSMHQGGQIRVTTQEVEMNWSQRSPRSGREESRGIKVSIADSGAGIRKEDLASIFDPFFTTKSHGTGLGLTVSHGIIQDHDGLIDVESELGRGTTVHVSFPLIHQEAVL